MEADLDDPHAVRPAPRQNECGRLASTLCGSGPRLVREPPEAKPGRPHQVPEADVREGRDVQSVSRGTTSIVRDTERGAYITATKERHRTWKISCRLPSLSFSSAGSSSRGSTGVFARGNYRGSWAQAGGAPTSRWPTKLSLRSPGPAGPRSPAAP